MKDEQVVMDERIDMGRRIRDVIEAPDGSILVIVDDRKGDLLRLTPAGGCSGSATPVRTA